jgi:TolB-like 6-blade propeller-like
MLEAGYLARRRWLARVALAALLIAGVAAGMSAGASKPRSKTRGAVCAPPGLQEGGGTVLSAAVVSDAGDLALPTRLLVHDPWAFVLDVVSDSILHVFRLADGALYQSLGRRGRGPDEFWSAWSISYDRTSNDAWVYDISLGRLTSIVVPRSDTGRAYAGRSIQLFPEGIATGAAWMDSTRLLVPGFFRDARIATLDGSGARVGGIGRSLSPASSSHPQVSQARMALHPDGRLAVLANRYLDSLELIDLDRATTTTVQGPVPLPRGGSGLPGLNDVAYVDVTVTATSIFALFSGRAVATFGRQASYGDCIHVFGWDGTFEQAIRLDGDVIAIAVAEDGSAIYALRHDPRPALVRFDLPAVRVAAKSPLGHRLARAGRPHPALGPGS